jgi:hypothetical protein
MDLQTALIQHHHHDNTQSNQYKPEEYATLMVFSQTTKDIQSRYHFDDSLRPWPPQQAKSKRWRPFFLLPSTMAIFAVIFALSVVALEIVNKVAADDRLGIGSAQSLQGRHYLWTYGPTACALLLTCLLT